MLRCADLHLRALVVNSLPTATPPSVLPVSGVTPVRDTVTDASRSGAGESAGDAGVVSGKGDDTRTQGGEEKQASGEFPMSAGVKKVLTSLISDPTEEEEDLVLNLAGKLKSIVGGHVTLFLKEEEEDELWSVVPDPESKSVEDAAKDAFKGSKVFFLPC